MNILPGIGLAGTGSRLIACALGNQYLYSMPEFEVNTVTAHIFKMSERKTTFKRKAHV